MTFRSQVPQWCALATRLLGWRPDEFWRATPIELADALRVPNGAAEPSVPDREWIQQMMERDAHD